MASYVITSPDGKKYKVTGEGSVQDALKYVQDNQDSAALSQSPRPLVGDIGRSGALTARYGAEGLAETADIFTNPIRLGLQQIPGLEGRFQESTSGGVKRLLDQYGVPKPRPGGEQIVGTGTKLLAGASPFVGAGQLAAKGAGLTESVGKTLSIAPGMQGATAAAAGAGGEYERQAGGGMSGQLVASLIAGMAPAGAKALADKAAKVFTPMAPQVEQILMQFDLKGVPLGVVQNLRLRVQNALSVGEVDQAGLGRLVDYATTNTTPTKAKISRDPVEFTQEENLSRQAASSNNPNIQQLARVKGNNVEQLINGLDDIAKGTTLDLFDAGEMSIKAISDRNDFLRVIQSGLYDKARDASGRSLPLQRDEFIRRADIALKQSNRSSFLPAEIRTMMNDIAYGQKNSKGEMVKVPFDVDTIDQFETILATAQRSTKDGNVKGAIGAVKDALMKTDLEEGASKEALKAFRQARNFSRKLFQWQKSSPAIHAIVDGKATPDQFVSEFVIGSSKKATVGNISKLMRNLPEEARAIVRNQVGAWIKNQATGKNADELQNFTQAGLRNALDKIGERKLLVIFGPADTKRLRAIQRVGSYEQAPPAGSAVNYSNTANTAMGSLSNWAEKLTSSLPMIGLLTKPVSRTVGNYFEGKQAVMPDIGIRTPKQNAPLAVPLAIGMQPQD